MTCRAAIDALLQPDDPGPDRTLLDHLANCPACAEIAAERGRDIDASGTATSGTPTGSNDRSADELERLFGAIRHVVARERGAGPWLAARPTHVRVALAVLATLAVAAVGPLLGVRPDLLGGAALGPVVAWLAILITAVAAIAVGMRPLHRPSPSAGLAMMLVIAAIAGPAVGALVAFATGAAVAPATAAAIDLPKANAVCFAVGILGAGLGGLALAALSRAPRGPRVWLLGAAAGATGALLLEGHCALTDPGHVILGHALVVAAGIAGAGLMRLGAVRERTPS